ncbi:LysR family transcriptional regulator [Finegoldia magna]|uniref:winged helix-turn-helix domain-containing protein n=1 Tax=Finegoldia magna TaxID=1260 RepID=UPI002904FEAD|nr:LysR family transcriptional regulator [Finegoldia magna]MDU2132733.1 LysR family transcriptional regulator [Finegoldia magna]MDU2220070.1 LysR family transcriptional regulator [Finegoldia magna]
MKVNCKFWFEDDNGKKFFGKGNYLLLKEIDKTKSLNKASKNLKMSYSKAFNIIKNSEKIYGEKFVDTEIGGANGGGSTLTETGERLIKEYEKAMSNFTRTSNNLTEKITKNS